DKFFGRGERVSLVDGLLHGKGGQVEAGGRNGYLHAGAFDRLQMAKPTGDKSFSAAFLLSSRCRIFVCYRTIRGRAARLGACHGSAGAQYWPGGSGPHGG